MFGFLLGVWFFPLSNERSSNVINCIVILGRSGVDFADQDSDAGPVGYAVLEPRILDLQTNRLALQRATDEIGHFQNRQSDVHLKHIEAEIAETVSDPEEQKAELAHLMAVMGR